MIRLLQPSDRAAFLSLAHEFYQSDAVLHPIPDDRLESGFDYMVSENPYTEGFLVESDGIPAGYAIIALTYSVEAGGLVLWLEELYLSPRFQGKGLGKSFFAFIEERYRDRAKRIRLEATRSNKDAIRLYERMGYQEFGYYQMIKEAASE